MNHAEMLRVLKTVQVRWWRHPIPQHAIQSYADDLAPLPYGDALAAVETLARGANDFPPSSGDIVLAVARAQVAPPEWDEVRVQLLRRREELRLFRERGWVCTQSENPCDGTGFVVDEVAREAVACGCRNAYVVAVRESQVLAPLVRAWIDEGGIATSDIDEIAGGDTTVEAQARDRWQSWAARLVNARAVSTVPSPAELEARENRRSELSRAGSPAAALAPAEGTDVLEAAGLMPRREGVSR